MSRTLVAVLCSFFILQTAAAAERKARILTIANASWSADLVASEPEPGTRIEISDCVLGPVPSIALDEGRSAIVRNIASLQCSRGAGDAHLTELTIRAGNARLFTQATYRDAAGDFNTVAIPEVTTSLAAGSTSALQFLRVESTADRSTFIALFAATPQFVSLDIYDGAGDHVGLEELHILAGFTWYELTSRVEIGRVSLRRGTTSFGCASCEDGGELTAIAFIGYRTGGSPRVEMPEERP